MNFGYDSINCFTLILCGESHLNDILKKSGHEALRQRITIHYNYNGLDDKEVASYILHKLKRAGDSKSIIEDAALTAIHGYSQGNPRLIDNLMAEVSFGSQAGKRTIDTDINLAVVDNQNLT